MAIRRNKRCKRGHQLTAANRGDRGRCKTCRRYYMRGYQACQVRGGTLGECVKAGQISLAKCLEQERAAERELRRQTTDADILAYRAEKAARLGVHRADFAAIFEQAKELMNWGAA